LHSGVATSTAALKITGRTAGPLNFHFYVPHPDRSG
jgi:hypothetical protein